MNSRSIELDADAHARLEDLARRMGLTKEECIREVFLMSHEDIIEEIDAVKERLATPPAVGHIPILRTVSTWRVDLDDRAEKDPRRIDHGWQSKVPHYISERWLIALSPQPQNVDSRRSKTFGSKIRSELTRIQPLHPDFGAN